MRYRLESSSLSNDSSSSSSPSNASSSRNSTTPRSASSSTNSSSSFYSARDKPESSKQSNHRNRSRNKRHQQQSEPTDQDDNTDNQGENINQQQEPPSMVSQNREPSPISSMSTSSSISSFSAISTGSNQSSDKQYSKPKSKWNNNTSSSSQTLSWSSESDSISSWSTSTSSQQKKSLPTTPASTNNDIPNTITEVEFQSNQSMKSNQSSITPSPEKTRMKWRGRQSSSSSLESITDQEPNDNTTEDQVLPSKIDGCKCRLNISAYNKHKKINAYQQHPLNVCQQGTTGAATNSQKANHTINLSLEDEVQQLAAGISQKFVYAPTTKQVAIDLFEGIRRFKNAIRWKEFFRKKALQETNKMRVLAGLKELEETDKEVQKLLNEQAEEQQDAPEGLKTGLHPSYTRMNAPKGSIRLEAFLHQVEYNILLQLDNYMDTYKDTNETSSHIKRVQQELQQNPNKIVVPTDKTNSFVPIDIETYDTQVLQHLNRHAKEMSLEELKQAFKQAQDLLKTFKGKMSKREADFLSEKIESKAVPTPILTIKDHKPKDPTTGQHPSRLVVPGQNFNSGYSKLAYLAIKQIFEKHNCPHQKYLIEQAYHLKEKLEQLKITKDKYTIISIDAKEYYPSVRLKLVEKAINWFARDLPQEDKATIATALKLTAQGLNSTYITYKDKYYLYDGNHSDIKEKGLTIGVYESAWLSDVVGSHLFQKTACAFKDLTKYHGIYRDDGIAIINNVLTKEEITRWMDIFQDAINKEAEGDYLQYTAVIWDANGEIPPNETKRDKVTTCIDPGFPYLDMELYWNENQQLETKVHLKKNQQLLYLNSDSIHPSHCKRNIIKSVTNRLAKLTTLNKHNMNTPVDELYPDHFKAIDKAGLRQPFEKIPTLAEAIQAVHEDEALGGKDERKQQQKLRDTKRTTYFCVGKAPKWGRPIRKIIDEAKKKYNLGWIRIKMSYHRFPNLREMFRADLKQKINNNIASADYEPETCNCKHRETRGCDYNKYTNGHATPPENNT